MISVCIATYNGEKYIRQQLATILCQLQPEDEVIISDDGSNDNTLDIIASLKDKRIKVFHHKKSDSKAKYPFEYVTRNFENALRHAGGNIIFLSDQDDIWLPAKVQTVTNALTQSNCILILHDCEVADETGKMIHKSYFELNGSRKGICKNLIKNSYLGCCMAFRKELLKTAIPFPASSVPHDIWLGLLAEWKGRVVFCNHKLSKYRRHQSNLSSAGSKSQFSLMTKITYRLTLTKAIIKRALQY
ncbi:MAG: glycosyltransferase family 2 protein [Porphyromonadaceae bacterium]|nr:glycosyltransferase family 2 protein [Porphyromonadaceae bacterium]